MKLQTLFIIFLIISMLFIVNVNAEGIEKDIVITDMTEEELESFTQIQTYGTTTTTQIAIWKQKIDKTKEDSYNFSIPYYYPVYEGVEYQNYALIYYQYNTSKSYYIYYYNENTTFVNQNYCGITTGITIQINATSESTLKDILYNPNYERTINAKVFDSDNTKYNYIGSNTSYYNKKYTDENHADTYYYWYKETYETEPPILNDDGTCKHLYEINTENGITTYVCRSCGHSYSENASGQGGESSEQLEKIHQTLLAIEFTGIFYILVHFTEKWRKVIMDIPRK